ncbi:MAG TPA: hypothetical protein P5080_00505 [Candidatus Paceibacterota bacterium]|nr:hypothetical protein [Candidatus Pacearchaeota archaeon]HRZ50456.1 hypothetical protein [Candidatus Paceibacterota bacterium]HSA36177.1 hypothetical protein [Candidatus Paceibacterota bacterium]
MKEFADIRSGLEEEIKRVMDDPKRTSPHVPEAAGRDVLSEVIELVDPAFYTERKTISVIGKVYLLTVPQLIKTLQQRYNSGNNNFASIALEVIDKGDSAPLAALSRFKTDEMETDLKRAHIVIRSVKENAAVVLQGLDPIRLVGEFVEDGLHTSGEPLRSIQFPFIVEAQEASFEFSSDGGVAITDGRTEKKMIISANRFSAYADGMENSIIEVRKGIKIPHAEDVFSVLGVLLTAMGLVLTIATRLRLAEIGIFPLIAGILLLYFRFGPWGIDYFSNRIIDIRGDAMVKMKFYGELR